MRQVARFSQTQERVGSGQSKPPIECAALSALTTSLAEAGQGSQRYSHEENRACRGEETNAEIPDDACGFAGRLRLAEDVWRLDVSVRHYPDAIRARAARDL